MDEICTSIFIISIFDMMPQNAIVWCVCIYKNRFGNGNEATLSTHFTLCPRCNVYTASLKIHRHASPFIYILQFVQYTLLMYLFILLYHFFSISQKSLHIEIDTNCLFSIHWWLFCFPRNYYLYHSIFKLKHQSNRLSGMMPLRGRTCTYHIHINTYVITILWCMGHIPYTANISVLIGCETEIPYAFIHMFIY